MATIAKPRSRRTLVASIILTVLVAAVMNGALAAFHFNAPQAERWPSFAPKGPAIGVIWIVLFAGMGAALGLVREKRAVVGLIALCLAYPLYTHLLSGHATELIGNIVTLFYAAWLALRVRAESSLAAMFVGCVALWIVFACALVIALVQLNGWATLP